MSSAAFRFEANSRSTSLVTGRIRCDSCRTLSRFFKMRPTRPTISEIGISVSDPSCTTCPTAFGDTAAAMKPLAVSVTKVRSLRGSRFPSRIAVDRSA